MDLQAFKKMNTILGIVVLIIATLVYTLTMEPTASLWDCGEFIAACYKLQVVHPPGAPLFLIIGRVFSLLSFGDPMKVAFTINFMSALCSGAAMMFLFWIITHLGQRVLNRMGELTAGSYIAILGAGLVGALSGTFTDSIWFSAVEGEVYSMSLFFTSLVVWAICKWDQNADTPLSSRWLLFIAFIFGCCIFIHWLNLLAIPAICFVYYFRRYEVNLRGALMALGVSILILGFILYGIITGFIDLAAKTELLFVNDFGLPFNSGVVFFFGGVILFMVAALWYTHKKGMALAHNAFLALTFILIGYSTITTVVIRSNANPYINMNAPKDVVSLASYLKREQYGNRPFLTGYFYTSKPVDYKNVGKKYARGKDKYEVVGDRLEYVYGKNERKKLFPRIWDSSFKDDYERWLGLKKNQKPSYLDNIKFMFQYQIGHMYFRYFMWNFVGRQNDEQGFGKGDVKNGNWISGIPFIDSIGIGPQTNLPDHVKNHPARNTYFFLPLLLGLLGLLFHIYNDGRRFTAIALLFFFTGLMIILQGNSPPIEPRERDYIFAGSFWAFNIWVGLGVLALFDMFKKSMGASAAFGATGVALLVPALMGFQNWDDHSRADRYAARDFAANYLESCAPNAIIFTQGDNDTYPLWYTQQVEGVRPDVRVVNLSLLGVDWYIEQIARQYGEQAGVEMSLYKPADKNGNGGVNKIRGTKRDLVPFIENPEVAPKDRFVDLNQLLAFIGDSKYAVGNIGDKTNYLPTKNLSLKADSSSMFRSGAIAPQDAPGFTSNMQWKMPKNSLLKHDLMVLDIIATNAANGWKRPIYFAISVSPGSYLGLEQYFQLEGLAYRLLPVKKQTKDPYTGRVRPDVMYDNVMNKFSFGNIGKPGVHVDSDLKRMMFNFRSNFSRLAESLIKIGEKEKAVEVMDKCREIMPNDKMTYDFYWYPMVENYFDAGAKEKGAELMEIISSNLLDELDYMNGLSGKLAKLYERDQQTYMAVLQQFILTAEKADLKDFANDLKDRLASVSR